MDNERAIALHRRLTVQRPVEPFTEVEAEDYAAAVNWLPAGDRFCSEKITDRPNLLFAGHWIVPKAED